MYILPFLWFTFLTILLWRKHKGVDISVYMSALYALTSFLAIVIVAGDMLGEGGILFYNEDAEFGLVPTVIYCVFLTMSIVPFHLVYIREVKEITCNAPILLDAVSLFLIVESFVNLYLVADSTLDILSGDLAAIRSSVYAGDETPAQMKAETMGYLFRLLTYFNVSTLLCLPILGFNLCFRQKPWWWNLLLFFASLSLPIAGIQSADRTDFVFWGLMLLYCFVFFWPHSSSRLRRIVILSLSPIVVLGVVYVTAVSQSRFENQNGGAAGRNVQYAGQGYVNFCFFWKYANYDELALERIFPAYSHFVKKVDSNAKRREERSGRQGFFISVFATFIGDLMLDTSPVGMMIWVICFTLFGLLLVRSSHRTLYDVSEVLLLFVMACIPLFGIFYYRFSAFFYSIMLMLALLLYFNSKYRVRL